MKDVSGNRLHKGDKVATMFDGYSSLNVVRVLGFTEKKIRVEHPNGNAHTKFPYQVSLVLMR